MNKIYCLVWSAARGLWVVAHEQATARGKGGGVNRRGVVCGFVLGVAGCLPAAMAAPAPPAPNALPQGGVVAAGNAQIGNAVANTLQVNQGSQRAVINWSSFDIGSQAKVQFLQPNADASVLNRVLANDPTQIFGQLSANGQVYIVNPSGILFGKGSRVDAGALVATTLNSTDDDFMAGRRNFTRGTATGSVVNEGSLNAAPGGYVALLGASVSNSGSISTPGGSALLAAGDAVQLPLTSSGRITLEVAPATINAVVTNSGEGIISAPDGQVYISATTAGSAAAQAFNRGVIDVSSTTGNGGSVTMQGHQVGLMGGSKILATGATGGGTVQIGGTVHDVGPSSASAVYVDRDALIDASTTERGNGGKVTLWSRDYTGYYGQINARGGAQGGDGGFVETSSYSNLQAFGDVSASSAFGKAGTWLLDPADVTIVAGATNTNESVAGGVFTPTAGATTAQIGVTNITTNLNAGTNVTIETASTGGSAGNITQSVAISKTAGAAATLTMNAAGSITLNATISSTVGALNTVLNAGGGISGSGNFTLLGGNLTLNAGGNGTLSGIFSGAGGLTKSGAGTTTLTGANTYTGTTTVSGGTLQVGNGATGSIGAGNITNDANLIFNRTAALTLANNISGTGNLTATSGSTLTMNGNVAQNGTISLTAGNSQPAGTSTGGNVVLNATKTFSAGGPGQFVIYSGTATTSLYLPRIAGSSTSTNKVYNTAPGGGVVDNSKTLNVFYRVAPSITVTAATKTYDGTSAATIVGTGIEGDIVTLAATSGSFVDANAGAGKTANFSGVSLTSVTGGTGVTVSGYQAVPASVGTTGTISKAPLTVTGNNASKNVTFADPSGYAGVTYSGFVNGETASVLGGSPVVTRTNTAEGVGTYSGVLLPAGLSSSNYQISYVGGNFTIVPASKVIVDIANIASVYGEVPHYAVRSAVYQFADGSTKTVEGTYDSVNNLIYVRDSTGALATFNPFALPFSTANLPTVGVHPIDLQYATGTTASFSNTWESRGFVTVTPRTLTINAVAPTKTYDGSTALNALQLNLDGIVTGPFFNTDDVTLSYTPGSYASKNAGTNLSYTALNLALGGPDAGNYVVNGGSTTFNGSNGVINPAALTLTAATNTKTYDGTTSAAALPVASGLVGGDTISGLSEVYATQHAGTGKTLQVQSGYTVNDGNGGNNYTVNLVNNNTGVINPATLTLTATGATKTYDGTVDTLAQATVAGLQGGDSVTGLKETFSDPNAGSGKTLAVSAYTINDGNGGGNYAVNLVSDNSGVINRAPLTVQANNDGKFLSHSDTPGYAGVSYSGFVNGETAAVLGGSLGISRSNAGVEAAGTYNNVLQPFGLTSNNYTISYLTGDFSIVPPNQLWVRLSNASSTYGSGAAYGLQSAQYMRADGTVVNPATSINNGTVTVNDGAAGTISFPVAVLNAATSTSGNLKVGSYQLGYGAVSGGSTNFSNNLTVNGAQVVNPLGISLLVGGVSKTYDATTSMTGLTLGAYGTLGADQVTVNGTGSYAGKNAGFGLNYTLSNLKLSGADSGNYVLNGGSTSYAGTNGIITPAQLTLTATTNNKVYDSTLSAAALPNVSGLMGSDTIAGLTQAYTDRNVGTGKTLAVQGGYTLNDGNGGNNYTVNLVGNAGGTITPAPLTFTAGTVIKTYDGTTVSPVAPVVSGLQGNDTVTGLTASFSDPNAGSNKTLTVGNGYTVHDGNGGNNYTVNLVNSNTSIINKAPLTVIANNDAKFVTKTDAAGYAGVSYSGFVNGEDTSVLNGTLSLSRLNSGTEQAAYYGNVLQASGLSASNYDITYVNGNYTIIPANELMVRLGTGSSTYGSGAATYGAPSAQYMLPDGTIVNVTPTIDANGRVTIDDGAGGNLTFDITIQNANSQPHSTSGNLRVGTYQLDYDQLVDNSNNFGSNLTVLGTQVITPATLSLLLGGTSKTYDGSNAMNGLTIGLNGVVNSDLVNVTGSGSYASKNAGTNLTYSLTGLTLSGADSANYVLNSSYTGNDGVITPKALTFTAVSNTKTYDGTTAVTALPTISGLVSGDTVTGLHESYADRNVGTGKTLAVDLGYTINDGNSGGNYTVNRVDNTGTITPALLTVNAANDSKTYDGTISSAATPVVNGLFGSDTVSGLSQVYTSIHAGTGKTLQVNGGYTVNDGNNGGNYVVNLVNNTSGVITPATLTLTADPSSKVYDGNTSAAGMPTVSGLLGSDSVSGLSETFADKNVGTGKALNIGYVLNDGNGGGNYKVTLVNANSGTITPATLTVTAVGNDKVYDTTTGAAGVPTVSGLVYGDTLTGLRETYADKNVGTGKMLSPGYASLNDGNGGGNYIVNLVSSNAGSITPASIVIAAPDNVSKFFDGTTSVPSGYLARILSGDLGEGVLSALFSYATPGIGNGKTVNISDVVMNDGNGGRNYQVTLLPSMTGAIVPNQPFLMSELERDKIEEPADATVTVQGCASGCVIQLSDIRAQLPDVSTITSIGGVGMADLPAGISYDRAAGLLRIDSAGNLPEFVTVHALGFSGKPRNLRVRLSGRNADLASAGETVNAAATGARLP